MSAIDFESARNEILINPRMPAQQAERLRSWLKAGDDLTGHIFVLTSGSTAATEADYKWVALSKQAVLAAAEGANLHLQIHSKRLGATGNASAPGSIAGIGAMGEARASCASAGCNSEDPGTTLDPRPSNHDTWLHCLPDFHVGGLGIWARAHLSGATVVRLRTARWNAVDFVAAARDARATLCSLVPTQVHDLVAAKLKAPESLRAVIVGGSALGEETYIKTRAFGWPVLPSYGMTETASQIATAGLDSLNGDGYPALTVLPHLQVEIATADGRIRVRGQSLLSGLIRTGKSGRPEFIDPKDADGWLTTDDFGSLGPAGLAVLGRAQDRIKIGGELVNLAGLRRILDEEAARLGMAQRVVLLNLPDARLESVVVLIVESSVGAASLAEIRSRFDSRVMPYEHIRVVRHVAEIPRTELGKMKWSELSALAQEQ